METGKTQRVLGVGNYEARWVQKSLIVELTATGILPCWNYQACLEKAPQDIAPAEWEMIFYVQPFCIRATRPFEAKVFVFDAAVSDKLVVHDAVGRHEVEIQQPVEDEKAVELEAIEVDLFTVHAMLPHSANNPHGCIVVPYGSILPAIYYRVFGPAPRVECEAYKAKHCRPHEDAVRPFRGEEVPWPLKARQQ